MSIPIPLITSIAGAGLRVALPFIVGPLMARLEKKLPNSGDGPKRKAIVMEAVRKLANSLMDDGIIDDRERDELLAYLPGLIETLVPHVEAQVQAARKTVTIGDRVTVATAPGVVTVTIRTDEAALGED